jgi:hypothetical protein
VAIYFAFKLKIKIENASSIKSDIESIVWHFDIGGTAQHLPAVRFYFCHFEDQNIFNSSTVTVVACKHENQAAY